MRTFESFKVPAYRVYYAATVGQWVDMSMQMMVHSLLIYRLTDSAFIVGVMALTSAVPTLLVSPFGGAVADRVQKKYVLFVGRVASVVVALAIAVPLTMGYLSAENPGSWWWLIACVTLLRTADSFTRPALISIIPEIVGAERVLNAISLSNMGQRVFRIVIPVLTGYLIEAYGFATVYYIMAGMYLLSAVILIFLPRTSASTIPSGRSPLGDILDGLHYIRRETIFFVIAVITLCHAVGGMPFNQLLPVFTESVLHVDATRLGILTSLSGVGSLLGSLVFASMPNRRRGLILMLSGVVVGLALISFSFSRWWYLSLAIVPFTELGGAMHSTMSSTIIQSYAEPHYRARMQSFSAMASGVMGFGVFFVGALSEAIGVQWAMGGMALFLTLVSIVLLVVAPRLRRLD